MSSKRSSTSKKDETGPVADAGLHGQRIQAENARDQSETLEVVLRRALHESPDGLTPEKWQKAYDMAVPALDEALKVEQAVEADVKAAAKEALLAQHSELSAEVIDARKRLENAGLLGRVFARRAVVAAEAQFTATFGYKPTADMVTAPPPPKAVTQAQQEALTFSLEVWEAQQKVYDLGACIDELEERKPVLCSERDQPKPPVLSTSQEEKAATAGASQGPAPTRGPGH